MNKSFILCSVYAFSLALLIFSHWISWVPLEQFLARANDLGLHGEVWMKWLGAACLFVGCVNALAMRWPDSRPKSDVAGATALIFGIWCLQNFQLMFTAHAQPLMWLHVAFCGVASLVSLASALRARGMQLSPE